MSNAADTHNANAATITRLIAAHGDCKEPELVAMSGLSERAVRLAVKFGVKKGYLALNENGALEHGGVEKHYRSMGIVR